MRRGFFQKPLSRSRGLHRTTSRVVQPSLRKDTIPLDLLFRLAFFRSFHFPLRLLVHSQLSSAEGSYRRQPHPSNPADKDRGFVPAPRGCIQDRRSALRDVNIFLYESQQILLFP